MREEFVLMEHVKEALCFVSADVRADLAAAVRKDSPHRREYVLPDGIKHLRGYVRDPKATAKGTEPAEGAPASRGYDFLPSIPWHDVTKSSASALCVLLPLVLRRWNHMHLHWALMLAIHAAADPSPNCHC